MHSDGVAPATATMGHSYIYCVQCRAQGKLVFVGGFCSEQSQAVDWRR